MRDGFLKYMRVFVHLADSYDAELRKKLNQCSDDAD